MMPRVRRRVIEPQLVVITGDDRRACVGLSKASAARGLRVSTQYNNVVLQGSTRLRRHAPLSLNTPGPADCQVCCTKVRRIVARVRLLRECIVCHFTSSDVLSDNRVNVAEEKSGRVIWYKVRTCFVLVHVQHAQSVQPGKVLDGQRDRRACHRAS